MKAKSAQNKWIAWSKAIHLAQSDFAKRCNLEVVGEDVPEFILLFYMDQTTNLNTRSSERDSS